jgi:hypothetical protein
MSSLINPIYASFLPDLVMAVLTIFPALWLKPLE